VPAECDVARHHSRTHGRKNGVQGDLGLPGFWNLIFSYWTFSQKRLFFQFRVGKVKFHHCCSPPRKILLAPPGEILWCSPPGKIRNLPSLFYKNLVSIFYQVSIISRENASFLSCTIAANNLYLYLTDSYSTSEFLINCISLLLKHLSLPLLSRRQETKRSVLSTLAMHLQTWQRSWEENELLLKSNTTI